MSHRDSPQMVQRALKMLKGTVLAREVEHLQREVAELRRIRGTARGMITVRDGKIEKLEAEVERLRAELDKYRSRVTTGGPPAPFTPGWERGDSSRPPTAPPEELVVALPVSDEELGELRYRTCEDCGHPHPAWISCEAERDVLAVDHVDEPPPR